MNENIDLPDPKILKLGIIAGKGILPVEIADLCKHHNRPFCIAALEGEVNTSLIAHYPHALFSVGAVGEIINYFTTNEVKEVLIIGAITRPEFRSMKVDLMGSLLIAKILKNQLLGDDNVLQIISQFIEDKGFKVISPMNFLQIADYQRIYVTRNTPLKKDSNDIQLGVQVLKVLGELDIGQAVVVCDGYVVGIEAAEGTDALISRCASYRRTKSGGVLIKIAKNSQDMRLDVPTIGPDTVLHLVKYGYRGLAIESKKVIIVSPRETLNLLDDNGLFISYI